MTKKHAIIEQQEKIKKMFSYKPGKTITENDKTYNKQWSKPVDINEIAPAVVAGSAGWALTAAWAGYEIWKWADNSWGAKSVNTKLRGSLSRSTWPAIAKSLKQTSIKLGEDIEGKLQVFTDSKAEQTANKLFKCMNGYTEDEECIRRQFDKMRTFMDLARVTYKYGIKHNSYGIDWDGDLWRWLDKLLSQSEFKTLVRNPMKSKPTIIWDGKQYNSIESWAVALTELVSDKKAQPKKDDQNKRTIINALKGKKGSCMEEYLENAVIGYTPKGVPYLIYEEGEVKLWVYANGRFADAKTGKMGTIQNCEEVVTESVDSILNLNWVLGSLTEQFKIIYDDDKDNVITIKDKEVVDTGGEITEPPSTKKTSKWRLYPWKVYPTEGQEDTYMQLYHYNTDKGHLIGTTQRLLCLKEDGYYGPDTQKRVKEFQKDHGLTVDGVIGPVTNAKLNEMSKDDSQITETGALNWCSDVETAGETTEKDVNVVDPVIEKAVEEKEEEYVVIPKENVPTERETLVKLVLDTEGNKKMQKNNCQNLIGFESGMLRANMVRATDLKALGRCYDNHNFGAGGKSRKVRKAYGLKTSKNNLG